jgi:lipoprotein-anchoring transpeptidase ErfK/SrfK
LALAVNHEQVGAYLDENANVLDSTRYLDNDNAITAIEQAVQRGDLQATLRVYHHDREHVVQSGETIISIAWDYGVPYPWIQQANPGVDALSVGQTLTIPSQDNFFQYDPVPDKRIVVSISQQKAWVYENGAVKWEWGVSTGINNSPTWPGVYQIISHEPNAYAANWDLYMPNFMGVYQPIPGQDFTNGFHGFPTRGGGQLLWENSIGTKVTYGCILLNNTNIQLLYDWAPEGVVVEIQA